MSVVADNRAIYDRNYSAANCAHVGATAYDRRMIALRLALIERFGAGRDVLDLCCGAGANLLPVLPKLKRAIALDFSANMLGELGKALGGARPANLDLVQADARALPLAPASIDFVFSFTSLYHVPEVEKAVIEVARVLRPGGRAVLEFGAFWSLNTLVATVQHHDKGWAKPFHARIDDLEKMLRHAGLAVETWRSFQLLPMYGAPLKLLFLYPLLAPVWKRLLGIEVGGRMLDEWLSSLPGLRRLAFRHLLVLRKP
ncbi:MAG: class I SAM-dependent methyltransferase [Alphaproteobacteria bacterium]|nr:class I SAM-dependent methyltransferase [Alphaproteobacteria bacterium]